jgi:hypothetical protein
MHSPELKSKNAPATHSQSLMLPEPAGAPELGGQALHWKGCAYPSTESSEDVDKDIESSKNPSLRSLYEFSRQKQSSDPRASTSDVDP